MAGRLPDCDNGPGLVVVIGAIRPMDECPNLISIDSDSVELRYSVAVSGGSGLETGVRLSPLRFMGRDCAGKVVLCFKSSVLGLFSLCVTIVRFIF